MSNTAIIALARSVSDSQELTIARLAGELTAERERCARLILQQQQQQKARQAWCCAYCAQERRQRLATQ